MHIILATTSVNRRQLFDRLGIKYTAMAPDYEENISKDQTTTEQVKAFARGKAVAVYQKISRTMTEDFCVIGFDSMVDLEGKSIGKPQDQEDAILQIWSFRGKPQEIRSGISIIGKMNGKKFCDTQSESTKIKFRSDYTLKEIDKYLEFNDWQGKCGSYSILGTGIFFLDTIEGDFQNIIGVPVLKMQGMLEKITGKKIWDLVEKV